MKRKNIILSWLALLCCLDVGAQNKIKAFEYWTDKNAETMASVVASDGNATLDLDFSTMETGLHSLSFRALDDNNRISPTMYRYFLVTKAANTQENKIKNYEYWIDKDYSEMKSVTATDGVLELDLDMSRLSKGLHTITYRAISNLGNVSSAMVKYFLVAGNNSSSDNQLTEYEYWIDGNLAEKKTVKAMPGETVIDIDLSMLATGMHRLDYRVTDLFNQKSAVFSSFFVVSEPAEEPAMITRYAYWFNNGPNFIVDVEPTTLLNLEDIEINPKGKIIPHEISSDYKFDVATGLVHMIDNVEFGIRVIGNRDLGVFAASQTFENMEIEIAINPEELTENQTATSPSPVNGAMKSYLYNCNPGDSILLEVTSTATIDLYDADGKRIDYRMVDNPQGANPLSNITNTDDANIRLLTFKAATDKVYALLYGADDIMEHTDITLSVIVPNNIETVNGNAIYRKGIYTLTGIRVKYEWKELPKGIYIVDGKKVIKQ